jgi:hypothetical protein
VASERSCTSPVWKTLAIFSIFALIGLFAQTPKASVKNQERIQWAGHALSEIRTLRELPPALQNVLGVGNPGMDGIADRNGEYNATDLVDSRLPMRHFLVAGSDGDLTLVAIERGGRAWRVEVTLFKKTAIERTWALSKSPETLRELVDRLPIR